MSLSIEQLVQQIHASPRRLVLAVAGGGSRAIAELLEVPGASRTVLEAAVPYSDGAMTAWLGGRPDQSCSPGTARAMAMAAFRRACRYEDSQTLPAGVACTAALATDRPRRGPHRVHVALQTASRTETSSLELRKGRRSREEEQRLVDRLLLNVIAEGCGVIGRLELGLLEGERIEQSGAIAQQSWQDVLLGKVAAVRHGGLPEQTDRPAVVIFPGAFNPLHVGHRRMAEIARETLGLPVEFEISILNVDKPPLDYYEIERRTGQFDPDQAVWLTRSATFEGKSELFPGATFVVGSDTLGRIAESRYYSNDPAARRAAMERIVNGGCRFLVFGRDTGSGFIALADLDLPEPLASACREVPATRFRQDVSSTECRASGEW